MEPAGRPVLLARVADLLRILRLKQPHRGILRATFCGRDSRQARAFSPSAWEVRSVSDMPLDCIYIAASALHSRFTRICVASVRYFYPAVPIRLPVRRCLQRGLEEALPRYWDVGGADLPV